MENQRSSKWDIKTFQTIYTTDNLAKAKSMPTLYIAEFGVE